MKKAPRYKRDPGAVGGLEIQPRDIEIIRLVHDYRFMDSRQIQALVPSSNQVILRRLQKLFHHDYLDRPISQIAFSNPLLGHESMIYGLGDRGADLLAERFGIDRGKILWKEKNQEVGERYIKHTLMVSNFRTCLTLALGRVSGSELLFWQRENPQTLKEYVYFKENGRQRKLPIVPDGLFAIQDPKGKMYFFFEADRSTMSNPRFKRKMQAYWLWWKQGGSKKKFGIENFRVLTLTRTKERMDNLIRTTRRADERQTGSYMFWFATEEFINLDDPLVILERIWHTSQAKDGKAHSILE